MAKMILGLLKPSSGEIYFEGTPRDISTQVKRKQYWQNVQTIFQDPFSAYNIFHKIDLVLLDCIRLKGGKELPQDEKFQIGSAR